MHYRNWPLKNRLRHTTTNQHTMGTNNNATTNTNMKICWHLDVVHIKKSMFDFCLKPGAQCTRSGRPGPLLGQVHVVALCASTTKLLFWIIVTLRKRISRPYFLNSKFKKICYHEGNCCADIDLSQMHGIQ